jgi:regulator of replication initiation timing
MMPLPQKSNPGTGADPAAGKAAGSPAAGASPSGSVKEEAHPPQVDGFKLKGALVQGKLKDLASVLRSISFLEIAPEKDALNVIYVESRDIDKNPYLFSIVKLKEDGVEVLYTIPPEIGPKKRKVDVVRYLLNIISLLDGYYKVEDKTLYQLVENSIGELAGSVTMDYTKLYTAYDSMKKEIADHKKKIDRLTEQNQALTSQNYELKTQNDDLRLRLGQLEGMSEGVLRVKLQEWISEHNGSISITDFAKTYKVAEGRIEEMLNKLVSEGYIDVIQ